MDLVEIVSLGERLGYEGQDLQEFVKAERVKQETILAQKLEREERLAQREERQQEIKRAHEIEIATREREILQLKANVQQNPNEGRTIAVNHPKIKIPPFQENRDNLDSYIERFARYALSQNWPKKDWAVCLSALLQGKALEVYSRMSQLDASNYETLKNALLKHFQMTEEGYRVRFHTNRPGKGETPTQFAQRLKSYLNRWIELSGIEQDFESVVDLVLREQFIQCCSKDLSVFLKEHDIDNIKKLAEVAEKFTEARGVSSFTASTLHRFKQFEQRTPTIDQHKEKGKLNTENISGKRRCYICNDPTHLANKCPHRSHGKKSVTQGLISPNEPTENSGQQVENTRLDSNGQLPGKVANETSSGCIIERLHDCCLGTSGNVELKCGHKIVVSNLQLGEKESNSLPKNMPTCEGFLFNQKVSVMRDSGSSIAVVRRSLVPKCNFTDEDRVCVLIDGSVRKFPVAEIVVDTPYYHGKLMALCVKNPVYDLIIGNVSGAKPAFEPDPNWTPTLFENFSDAKTYKQENLDAVETRAMKELKKKPIKPLDVPSPIGNITPEEFLKEQTSDESLSHLWEKAKQKLEGNKYRFVIHNKILVRECISDTGKFTSPKVVVPTKFRESVMKLAHESLLSGHLGIARTYYKVFSEFYWPGIHQDVTNYCRSCDICQRTLDKGRVTPVPLGKVPLIDVPFHHVAMDLIGPLHPATDRGNRFILTVVDYATRYPDATPLRNIDTVTVAEALVEIYSRVGVPSEVLTDCGSQFTPELMKEVSRLLSIKQLTSTPYHPIANGLIERFNGTLKQMLKKMCNERPRDWDRYVIPLLFAYREAPQESLGFSPFELLYGRSVRGPMTILKELWTNEIPNEEVKSTYQYVVDLKSRLSDTCDMAQRMLSKSSKRYKAYYDRAKRPRKLNVGDKVLILLPTDHKKLTMQWKGPYTVTGKFAENDYTIDVNGKEKSYHINLLKKYLTRNTTTDTIQGIFDQVGEQEENEVLPDKELSMATVDLDELAKNDNDKGTRDIVLMPSSTRTETSKDVHVGTQLSSDQIFDLQRMMDKYDSNITDVPLRTNAIECEITLTTDEPVRSRPYSVPYARRQAVKDEINKMLELGIISRSNSPYAAPIVLVPKKDGTVRFCIDFRRLNKVSVFDPELMPNPEELFSHLNSAKYFSKIDLSKGY